MRSLGHLKMLVGTMLVTVDHPKHQVLCCSGRGACQCCPPHVLEEEDLLGLAHSEKDLQSMESLDLASDVNISFKRLKTYLPFLDSTVTVDPVWKKKQTRETVSRLSRQINLLRGGAQERDENPAMFIPGRVLHLEDSHQYGLNQ